MFQFKDSNFYVNQVCVPDAVAQSTLHDGARVTYDPAARTATFNATGDYIVLGEALNRDSVTEVETGLYQIKHGGGYAAGTPARIYRLANLVGLEFVTDKGKGAVKGNFYQIDASGALVAGGSAAIRLKCIGVNGDIATLICTDEA